jgi:hypothetical protein
LLYLGASSGFLPFAVNSTLPRVIFILHRLFGI